MSPITAPIAPITVVKDEKEEEHGDEQHSASYDASASQSPSDSEERSRTEGRASSEDHIVDVEETSQTPLETTTASDPDGIQIPGKRGRMLSRDVCRPQPAVFCQHCPGRKSNTRETKREDFSLFLPHPLPIYLIIFFIEKSLEKTTEEAEDVVMRDVEHEESKPEQNREDEAR